MQGIQSGRQKLTGIHTGRKNRVREMLGSTALGRMWDWSWAKAVWKRLGKEA